MFGPRFGFFVLPVGFAVALLTAGKPAAAEPAEGDGEEHPEPIPPATDRLGGHLVLRAGPLVAVPFGALDGRTDFSDTAGVGLGAVADLGIGISRVVVLGGWFEYTAFGNANDHCGCDARSIAAGPFARYHLVQGTRFDPWLSLGVGYRRVETRAPSSTYSGFDARLELGGDWYALSQIAFGPYAGLSLGSFTDRPGTSSATAYGSFTAGLRIAFDVKGR
jgi:hypothetical protein